MNTYKRFARDTFIYGLATVLPRLMNFLLVPLHTDKLEIGRYAENTQFFVYAAFFNVILSFGMETAFFRFYNREEQKSKVYSTTLISLTTFGLFFFVVFWGFSDTIASWFRLNHIHFQYLLGVLVLDALVVAPFAYLRAIGKSKRFTSIKMANIFIFVILNFYFLWLLPKMPGLPHFETQNKVEYIFFSNLLASLFTLGMIIPYFLRVTWRVDRVLLKKMLIYAWPIMVAGVAYVINENLDKLMLENILGKELMGAYSGCYKLAVFMTIFIQAFRLGAEPFFFNYASRDDAAKTYATIMKYFVAAGSLLLLLVIGYIDFFKELLIRQEQYWIALDVVPILLLANLFLGIYHNLSIWYKLTDQTHYGMWISVFGAGLTILLNIWLIPVYGFMASAWATLAAYGGMAVMSFLLGRRRYPIPYALGKIAIFLGFAIFLAWLLYVPFRGNIQWATLSLFVFLFFFFLLERQEIKQILFYRDPARNQ